MTSRTPIRRRLPVLGLAGLLAALAFGLPGSAPATAAGGGCKRADSGIDEATAKQLAKAVRCLINDDRTDRGLPRLDLNDDLQKAAGRHNRKMLRDNCWKHKCPGEPDLETRIKRTGYLDGAERWRYAEVFGCHATPALMVDYWLDTQFPRSQLRKQVYRDFGVAAARDQVPKSECDDGNEATYTVVLGYRKR